MKKVKKIGALVSVSACLLFALPGLVVPVWAQTQQGGTEAPTAETAEPDDGAGKSVLQSAGEYLDFHPHLHALVADGLFARSGLFYVLPDVGLKPLEELFRARVITFLVDKGLLPPARPPPEIAGRVIEPCYDDPFPDYPVTTLSRGRGLKWRHRAGDDVRASEPARHGVT